MQQQLSVIWINDANIKFIVDYKDQKKQVINQEEIKQRLLEPLAEVEEDVYLKPTAIVDDGSSNLKLFGFQTPKKQVHNKILSPSSKKTPQRKGILSSQLTPKSSREDTKFQKSSNGQGTPYSFRKRVCNRIQKIVLEDETLSSSDEYSPSEEDSSENECKMHTPEKTFSVKLTQVTPSKTPSRGRRAQKLRGTENDIVSSADEYFIQNSEIGNVLTSDHTLGRLSAPRLAPDTIKCVLKDINKTHEKECMYINEEIEACFYHWMSLLCEGFNIILYGFGSKKNLLSRFQEEYLSDQDHIVINGFFPSLTLKSITNAILECIDKMYGGKSHDVLEKIHLFYSLHSSDPLYIVIHNIDGPMLRGEKMQTLLSTLASFPKIHIICSVDHINSPLILDSCKMWSYNAIWWDATTFLSYIEETAYENSVLIQQPGALAISSLIHVFRSLTPSAKGIFLILAKLQLEQKEESNFSGINIEHLYQKCREAFLVNSDLVLRAQLTEFKDHKLLQFRKGYDGGEHLSILLPENSLKEFIEQNEVA